MKIFTNKHFIAVCAMVCGLYANSVMAQVTNDSTVVSDDAPTTIIGNARASMRGMDNRRFHALFVLAFDKM